MLLDKLEIHIKTRFDRKILGIKYTFNLSNHTKGVSGFETNMSRCQRFI